VLLQFVVNWRNLNLGVYQLIGARVNSREIFLSDSRHLPRCGIGIGKGGSSGAYGVGRLAQPLHKKLAQSCASINH
jgi:hypothetical protein